jgi:Flp pilus assembly pilin Flp
MARLISDCRGATVIEYVMVSALISIAAASVITGIGSSVTQMFQQIAAGF